jgi:hypothetical protein
MVTTALIVTVKVCDGTLGLAWCVWGQDMSGKQKGDRLRISAENLKGHDYLE